MQFFAECAADRGRLPYKDESWSEKLLFSSLLCRLHSSDLLFLSSSSQLDSEEARKSVNFALSINEDGCWYFAIFPIVQTNLITLRAILGANPSSSIRTASRSL